MKQRTKRILGCITVLALCVVGLLIVGRLLDPESTSDSMNAIHAFHKQDKNSIDVMAFGTSHVWKGFDPRVLRDDYNISAFNYAGNWQGFNTTLLFMQDAFKSQTPKVVLVDTYVVHSLIKNIQMEGQIYYTRAIGYSPEKLKFLRDCFGRNIEYYVSYIFPIVAFHDNWINLKAENFVGNRSRAFYMNTLGYDTSCDVCYTDLSLYGYSGKREIPEDSIEVLDTMVELCRENNTVLIFYTCPYEGTYDFADAMQEYSDKNGCIYLNLFEMPDEVGLDPTKDFRDTQHLNDSGSAKIADFFGRYLKENGIIAE